MRIFRLRLGNHPSVTFDDSSPRRGVKDFAENCCGICYKAPERSRPFPTEHFIVCGQPTNTQEGGGTRLRRKLTGADTKNV